MCSPLVYPTAKAAKAAPRRKPYTPQFSETATVSVRRLAWALQISMPKTMDRIVDALPSLFSPSDICPSCKDNAKCGLCVFARAAAEKAAPAV
jgi:hypothetical protein